MILAIDICVTLVEIIYVGSSLILVSGFKSFLLANSTYFCSLVTLMTIFKHVIKYNTLPVTFDLLLSFCKHSAYGNIAGCHGSRCSKCQFWFAQSYFSFNWLGVICFPPSLAPWFCNNLDNGSKIGLSLSFSKGHFFLVKSEWFAFASICKVLWTFERSRLDDWS